MKRFTYIVGLLLLFSLMASCRSAKLPEEMVDTTWQWSALTETMPAAQSVVPNPENYTIVFSEDGNVAIQADCNMVTGTYEITGDALTIELGPSTMAFCGEESLDNLYVTLLDQVTSYELDGDKLVLNFGEDAGQMFFDNGGPVE